MVFDVRVLPNPYYDIRLRPMSGRDEPVITFLEGQADVLALWLDIRNFVEKWLPAFKRDNRSYLTVAIGCTGGQHRSVYMAERLARHFAGTRIGGGAASRTGGVRTQAVFVPPWHPIYSLSRF